MFRLALFALLALNWQATAEYKCKWAAQGTDQNFKADEVINAKPQITKGACGDQNQAPTCIGYIYCKDQAGQAPPKVTLVSCAALDRNKNRKWRCPDAWTCHEDQSVAVSEITKKPSRNLPTTTPQAPAGALPEGQGSKL